MVSLPRVNRWDQCLDLLEDVTQRGPSGLLGFVWRSVGGLSLVDRRLPHFQLSRALVSLPLLTLEDRN